MSGVFENTLCSTPYQGDYLATASATANALDLSATAALIEREGLRFDGTAGAVIGNGGIPAVGTGDFTVLFNINQDAASSRWIIGGSGGSTFQLAVYHYGAGYLARTVLGSPFQAYSNSVVPVGTNAVLGYVRSSGVGTFKVGASDDGSAADANNYTSPINVFSGAYESGSIVPGLARKLSRLLFFNYALAQSEITALIGRGLVTLPEQRGGSMVTLNTGFTGTGTGGGITSSTSGPTNLVLNGTASSNMFYNGTYPAGSYGRGRRFLISFTKTTGALRFVTGALTFTTNSSSGGISEFNNLSAAGTYTIDVTVSTGTLSPYFYVQTGDVAATTVSNFSVIPLGTLFEQDSGQRNAGYTVRDTSGNNADIILPASGVSVIDPAMRGVIRFTTNTSGNQQIGGSQVIIPTNARISSWVINSSGTPNVTLGNVSAGAQYRASAAVVSGDNQITLLTPFTPTGNLWVNSSTTATLEHTIMWEYLQ
jgi:hypothetical protein